MSLKKKAASKIVSIEASGSGKPIEDKPKIVGSIYDDIIGSLEK